MANGNGRVFTVAVGSKQSYVCPQVDTAGEELPMKHLLDEVYDKKNPECQECGVCEAASSEAPPVQKQTPAVRLREKVRPHGCHATRERTIHRVSAGMAKR